MFWKTKTVLLLGLRLILSYTTHIFSFHLSICITS
nr:MAG TPA: hypothetical protein [Caudoviricetes sp.]